MRFLTDTMYTVLPVRMQGAHNYGKITLINHALAVLQTSCVTPRCRALLFTSERGSHRRVSVASTLDGLSRLGSPLGCSRADRPFGYHKQVVRYTRIAMSSPNAEIAWNFVCFCPWVH